MNTEYRVVCSRFGEGFRHREHKWEKKGKDRKQKTEKSVIELNRHAEMASEDHFYKDEAPYQMQTREVTDWSEVSE